MRARSVLASVAGAVAGLALLTDPARGQGPSPTSVLPPSNQLSAEARAVLLRIEAAKAPDFKGDLSRQKAFYGAFNDERLAEMRRGFKVVEAHDTLNGVPVDTVEPIGGASARNKDRVLINVHGGAFLWGAGSGALVEAIPIAATMGVRVVAVDYRLAPEHRYPAASEDVAAVYRALLARYPAANIGIYGCSAGGVITAQAVAWIRRQGLPRPGAIGTLCGTGAPYSGDSPYLAGLAPTGPGTPPLPDVLPTPYMAGVSHDDAAAYPLTSDAETALMPPTLLLAGGRDFAVSALSLAHRRLARLGVESDLQLFDGLPHAFFVWPDMPESKEAYARIASFFDRWLGVDPLSSPPSTRRP
ncbi:alpha/beta hydrolase [Caulobacter sp. RL271]|uniref:Alpha/beta hydrolase n=1 Tax=Caulobacter segnis TaxID=88688 RepID=A0ABY4ZRU6_9CAUL|nr:alpha/beta hydrolase fold domain-containing protein [Caulobacter segnis]USQ95420.1 alpha/beta hydrolase [Caulobacter segnis]